MVKLLDAATTTETGSSLNKKSINNTFQAVGSTSSGAGACSVLIQASNDNINWLTMGIITLVLDTTEATDGFSIQASWDYVRAKVSSISGTDANVTVYMGA